MVRFVFIILYFLYIPSSFGQPDSIWNDIRMRQEFFWNDDVLQEWSDFSEPVLDLNRLDIDDAGKLQGLSKEHIRQIQQHRDRFGDFNSIYELQQLNSIPKELLRIWLPALKVDDVRTDWKHLLMRIRQEGKWNSSLQLKSVLEQKMGYVKNSYGTSHYQGDPMYTLFKLMYKKNQDFSIGLLGEKDPGESFTFDQTKWGFDYWNFHLAVFRKPIIDALVIGHWQMASGLGLVWGRGNMNTLYSNVLARLKPKDTGLRPAFSSVENIHPLGVGMTFKVNPQNDFSLLCGFANKDAYVVDDSLSGISEVLGFNYSGLHRTNFEIGRKNNSTELVAGLHWKALNRKGWKWSMQGYYIYRDKMYYNPSLFYDAPPSKERAYGIGSIYSEIPGKKFHYYQELAINNNASIGFKCAAFFMPDSRTDVSLTFYSYAPTFYAYYSDRYSGIKNNREGIEFLFSRQFHSTLSVQLECLLDRKINSFYNPIIPLNQSRFALLTQTKIMKRNSIGLRLLYLNVNKENKTDFKLPQQNQSETISLQLIFHLKPSSEWQWDVQSTTYFPINSRSSALMFGQSLQFRKYKFKLFFSSSLFSSELSERMSTVSMLFDGTGTTSFVYGNGILLSLGATYKLSKIFKILLRYNLQYKSDTAYIGYGAEKTNGPFKSDIQLILTAQE